MSFIIIFAVVILLIIASMIIYEMLKTNLVNKYEITKKDYCNFIPDNVKYLSPEIDTNISGAVYNKVLAMQLLEICLNTSIYNCRVRKVVLPPGFTDYKIMQNKTGISYGIIYYNIVSNKIIIAFSGSLGILNYLDQESYEQVTPALFFSSSTDQLVNTDLYNIYITYCQQSILDVLELMQDFSTCYITGHSIGGALSILCAADIYPRKTGYGSNYSFGAPKVGNDRFVKSYNRFKGVRINNTEDIYAQIPSVYTGSYIYEHVDGNVPFTYSYGNAKQNHFDAYQNFLPDCPLLGGPCGN